MFEFHLKYYLVTSFTWLHPLLLLLLFLYHVDAQTSMEPVPTYISHHNWEPSFAITVGAIICVLLFMGIISIYIRKCAESRIIITRTNPIGTTNTNCPCSCSQGINKELLNTFPIIFYSTIKDLKTGKGPLECAVCLTDFKDQDTLRLLPKCNHVFHPQCIDSWLASHVTCPVCRANLNQDSCQVAITISTHFSNDQMGEEGSETRGETHASEENEIEPNPNPNQNQNQNQNLNPNPVVHKDDQDNCDDGGVSKSNLLRSNSTGHSMVEPVKCVERYTLRLPEDVRTYILVNHERSSYNDNNNNNNNNVVKGSCWSDSEGSSIEKGINEEAKVERWVLCPCAPPFVTPHG